MVSAREVVVTFWKDLAFGEGQRALIGKSTTKEGAPLDSNNQLASAYAFSAVIEAEGTGSKITEVRFMDMAGSLLSPVITKITEIMPKKNFTEYEKKLNA